MARKGWPKIWFKLGHIWFPESRWAPLLEALPPGGGSQGQPLGFSGRFPGNQNLLQADGLFKSQQF